MGRVRRSDPRPHARRIPVPELQRRLRWMFAFAKPNAHVNPGGESSFSKASIVFWYRPACRSRLCFERSLVEGFGGTNALAPTRAVQDGPRAFCALLTAVTRAVADLDGPSRDALPLAMARWSTVHGFVSRTFRSNPAGSRHERPRQPNPRNLLFGAPLPRSLRRPRAPRGFSTYFGIVLQGVAS